MISDQLAQLLEQQSDRLTQSWVQLLKKNENTTAYHRFEDEQLVNRIHAVYDKLHLWLDWEVASADLARYFMMIGFERQQQDVPLSEMCYAIILARRNLYMHIMEEMVPENALEMQRLNEFNSRVTYFFDKAMYFAVKGYEGEQESISEDNGMLERILLAFKTGTSISDQEKLS